MFPITSRILNAIGDFMPDWLILISPMIAFVIAAFIWVGIPKDEEEKNENS